MSSESHLEFIRNTVWPVQKEYYDKARELSSEALFNSWIESLSEPIKSSLRTKGYVFSKNALPFLRFVAEMNDLGLDQFMKERLTEKDFERYVKMNRLAQE
jgi:phage gp29-like protein